MNEISFFVDGIPRPQTRPRVLKTGHVYTPDRIRNWKTAVKVAALCNRKEIVGPLYISLIFLMPRPKRLKKRGRYPHTGKPDLDNLIKAVMDGLTNAQIWGDDSQVTWISSGKFYHSEGEKPGVSILIAEYMEPKVRL